MNCPKCGKADNQVVEIEFFNTTTARKYLCHNCSYKFRTSEEYTGCPDIAKFMDHIPPVALA